MNLLDALIAQGMKNNAEFTKELIEIKQRVANTPEIKSIQSLKTATRAMQDIDDFTLGEAFNTKTDTQAMKEIDEFTLEQVGELNSRITELEGKVNGGTA